MFNMLTKYKSKVSGKGSGLCGRREEKNFRLSGVRFELIFSLRAGRMFGEILGSKYSAKAPLLVTEVTLRVTERGTPRIVHFKATTSSFQIVAFLNDLYLALDNILGNYDVFKVSSVIMKSRAPLNAQVG